MGKKKAPLPNQTDIYNRAQTSYNNTQTPSAGENAVGGMASNMQNSYNRSVGTDTATSKRLMQGFQDYGNNAKFSYNKVANVRPKELDEGYGYLREAVPGYRDFAATGGYTPQDIQETRQRGISPIRSAYGNSMMEMDRARSLGGNGGSQNYIAAQSKALREQPGAMADAMGNVNASLNENIRSNKLAGLAGISGIGSTMGGFADSDANRSLQAAGMNQAADLQTQSMTDAARRFGLSGQSQLYGTTPGMSSMFGNQALNAYQTRAGMEQNRNQFGLGLMDAQIRSQNAANDQKGTPWWKTALSVAGTVAPYVAMAASSKTKKEGIAAVDSSRDFKKDITELKDKEVSSVSKSLKDLPLYTWKYKGEKVKHFGPIAEEFKEKMGVGDGKSLHLADVMGVILASQKEQLNAK